LERGPGGEVKRETNTMPGYAGSSWYFLRYMDPHNEQEFADRKAVDYWRQVDLYIGGTEHAVGHLLYSRMWTKCLYDLGYIGHDEPYKKLLNQGMIQGSSRFVYRVAALTNLKDLVQTINEGIDAVDEETPVFISHDLHEKFLVGKNAGQVADYLRQFIDTISSFKALQHPKLAFTKIQKLHVDVNLVDGVELNIAEFKNSKPDYANAEFILEEDGKYICGVEVEKMSKSKYNVVSPDDIVEKYGADTFRMYEMFLGPVEQSKPWDTKGIEGVHRFLRKLWRMFVEESKGTIVNHEPATDAELKVLHKTIKKIEEDTERFSFNTAVSAFMVCVNELNDLKCHKKEILEPLVILLTPYAPHIAEELWNVMHNDGSVLDAVFPKLEEKYLVESSKEYPVSINGKVRTNINISLDAAQQEVEQIVLANQIVQKWLDGKLPKKIIFVKGRMINVVI
jgi:leucyl-tRNA synthetase